VWHDANEYPHLVAYTTREPSEQIPAPEALRAHLKSKLPDHMVPAFYQELETLPLTVNGKINRSALPAPEAPTSREFTAPRNRVEQQLAEIWCSVLGVPQVSVHDNFFELGGDSILSIQIVARALRQGIQLNARQLFEHQTIAGLAAVAESDYVTSAPQGILSGVVPLTPIQHWFFGLGEQELHHFNQAFLLEVSAEVTLETLQQMMQVLLEHHDGLRVSFEKHKGQWEAQYQPIPKRLPCHVIDLEGVAIDHRAQVLEQALNQVQGSLELEGPLLRFAYIQMGEGQAARLLLTVHHLVIDGVSWRVLLEDLSTVYNQLLGGQSPSLPAKSSSVQQWAEQLQEYAESRELEEQLDYWSEQPYDQCEELPVDAPVSGESYSVAHSSHESFSLSQARTEVLLQQVPAAYHTQINDVLLAALVLAYQRWSGQQNLLLNLEGHGREELFETLELSRTVGWFTSVYPVLLQGTQQDLGTLLKGVKEQLRAIPHRGVGYGILRYLGRAEVQQQLSALPQAQLSFNYLGQTDSVFEQTESVFSPAAEAAGVMEGLRRTRGHLLDIGAIVYDGALNVDFTYSSQVHQRESIEGLVAHYREALEELIEHCLQEDAGGYTPSDFPAMTVGQKQLDAVLEELDTL
jgi:non-ribosomal peptide synthase protein (TIGR01720 family)